MPVKCDLEGGGVDSQRRPTTASWLQVMLELVLGGDLVLQRSRSAPSPLDQTTPAPASPLRR